YWFALILNERRTIQLSAREHLEYRWLPAAAAAQFTGSWSNRQAICKMVGLNHSKFELPA
ncbi:MAG: hypothetical protein JZU59_08890, partial [Chromatium okenii]|nr:hypothetical protein [Chromatium okenii]